ncbi:TPR repeat-containing protein [Diplonema papillatum]|nr:TPR repeat-containing protein [Diplonema papillatum]KAJ9445202.1 TPR repeat-containing protein [Diplonema papillatum]
MVGKTGGRIRTESMIDRLGRKPIAEGFELWDKDYMLGALRLFQCKLEVAPPFEVAACLDAVGDILTGIEEPEEATDHYNQAVSKYKLIGKTILSELMQCKAIELQEGQGPEAALDAVNKILALFDQRFEEGKSGEELLGTEAKGQGPALGKAYLYRAELLKSLEKPKEAMAAVDRAITLNCDRIHLAYGTQGDILMELEAGNEAVESYKKAVQAKPIFVAAYESMIKAMIAVGDEEEALRVIETVLKLHPKAVLIREKAFIYSNQQKDDQALALLDAAIADPPHEETETLTGAGPSVAILRKAKAAILADLARFEEANDELSHVISNDIHNEDDEANHMRKDIFLALARDYLGKNEIPTYLDSLVAKVLESKPQAPIPFMIEQIEKEMEKEKNK